MDYARQKCSDVEFTPEDAGRTDKAFLLEVLGAVIRAGASTVNIADTVGYNTPESFGELINYLIKNTEGSDKVISIIILFFRCLSYFFSLVIHYHFARYFFKIYFILIVIRYGLCIVTMIWDWQQPTL